MNRQILAQQLAAAVDPQSMSSLRSGEGRTAGGGAVPFFGGGAVGYQPMIIWLPSRRRTAVISAVVSADRRYVRITATPFFSGVSQVNTFNTTTGETGTQSQNNNGNTGSGFNPAAAAA